MAKFPTFPEAPPKTISRSLAIKQQQWPNLANGICPLVLTLSQTAWGPASIIENLIYYQFSRALNSVHEGAKGPEEASPKLEAP